MVKEPNLIYTELFLNNKTGDSILFYENRVIKQTLSISPQIISYIFLWSPKLAIDLLCMCNLPYVLFSPSTKYIVLQNALSLLHVHNKDGSFIEEGDTVK